ncbi:putative Ig domain-containing protein [candidate division KSB1 bacterium]|nr:putative Ig domain-containing protein [candidate division KSB1 bacterium]
MRFKKRNCLLVFFLFAQVVFSRTVVLENHPSSFAQYDIAEFTLTVTDPVATNPFVDAVVSASITDPNVTVIPVKGFCDSSTGELYKIRFTPSITGNYSYQITFQDAQGSEIFSGTFSVTTGNNDGFIIADPQYPNHFKFTSGGRPFICSKTAWVIAGVDETIVNAFLDKMVPRQENCIRFGIECDYYVNDIGIDVWPWGGTRDVPDFSTYNVEVWQDIERVLQEAGQRDIYSELVIFCRRGYMISPAEINQYLDYIIARLAPFPSVILLQTFNENEYDYYDQEAMGNYLHTNDPYSHLVSPSFGTSSDAAWPNKSWVDVAINHYCVGSTTPLNYYYTVSQNIRSYGKPAWCDETGREVRHGNDDGVNRRKQYWIWNIGGTYWNYHSYEGCEYIQNVAYNGPGSEYLPYIRPFWEGTHWWEMSPNNSILTNNPDSDYEWCLASDSELVVYLVNETTGGTTPSETINLNLPSGFWDAKFYNPADGSYNTTFEKFNIEGGGIASLPFPAFTDDLVIYLAAVDEQNPIIVVDPDHFDFFKLDIGQSDTARFMVHNEGHSVLNVSALTLSGPDVGDFSLLSAAPFSVAPNDSAEIQVEFTPSSEGLKAADLIIDSNDFNVPQYTVILTGNLPIDEEFENNDYLGYTVYIPKAGPDINMTDHPGFLRITVPSTASYDHWRTVDDAPQLRRKAINGDWELITKVNLLAVPDEKFHVGLMLYFSRYDLIYWGFNGGIDTIDMTRVNYIGLINVPYSGGSVVELRIRKEADTYYFEYREEGALTWIVAGSYNLAMNPSKVGLIAKTWIAADMVADFDYLRLNNIEPDTDPPVFSNVASTNITSNSAIISWNTDEPATAQIKYGQTTDYGNRSVKDAGYQLSHAISLNQLIPNTTYFYRLIASDGLGNKGISQDYTFTTNPKNVTPLIYSFTPDHGLVGTEVTITGDQFIGSGADALKVMPLGNSITSGFVGSTDSSGYRNDLADLLESAGVSFDFVGSLSTGYGFDGHHEGHDGAKAENLQADVTTYLTAFPADVVLLHAGTNDISNGQAPSSIITEIEGIVDNIYNLDPNISIVLSSLVPRTDSKESNSVTLNNLISDLVDTKVAAGYSIFFADINTAFKQHPSWATVYMYNYLHPNDTGYFVMAQSWFDGMMAAVSATANTAVAFNDTLTGEYSIDSEIRIRAIVPDTATTGPITVTTAHGTASSLSDFTVEKVSADFLADVTSGVVPLTVNFTDLSVGTVDSWTWTFNDGTPTSGLQHPQHVFNTPGDYTIELTITGGGDNSTETKVDYIHVAQQLPVFTDITTASGTSGYSANGYGHGISFADMDFDGFLDIFASNATSALPTPDLLYINQHNNSFVNEADNRGTGDVGMTHAIVSADFDHDGDPDVFFSNMPASTSDTLGRNAIYRNNGNGYFSEMTDFAGLTTDKNGSRGAVALDIEKDGDLDLYVVNWGELNEMYTNNGDGVFTQVDRGAAGLVEDPAQFGQQGVTTCDVDNDGDMDIYVCRRKDGSLPAPNYLFINDGSGNFSDQAAARGVNVDGRSHGAAFADVDTDGDMDLFVVNFSASGSSTLPKLGVFFNNGNGTFQNKTDNFNISVSGYSVTFGDVDNDTDLDMYLLRNDVKEPGARPELYLNDGSGNFTLVASTGLEIQGDDVRGAAYADIDNDGDLDFYVTCTYGNNFLLRNDTDNDNHYIDILCMGPLYDYGGIGSRVSVYEPGHLNEPASLLGYQEVVSNFGYTCQNQLPLHFGLGAYTACDIKVVLTDGQQITFTNVPADQLLEMDKGTPQTLVVLTTGCPDGEMGEPYRFTLQAQGGRVPYEWSIAGGALPSGLILDTDAGQIAGTPSATGTFNFTVMVTDNQSPAATATQILSIEIPVLAGVEILTTGLAPGTENSPYSATLQAQNGLPPYTWDVFFGSLPPGVTLDTNSGQLGGTPTSAGIFDFTVRVRDSQNPAGEDTQALQLTISNQPTIDEEFVTQSLAGYNVYVPLAGPVFDVNARADYLRLQIPSTNVYDHWKTVDKAPQLRRTCIQGDWSVQTKVELVSVSGSKYQVGLQVYFSRYDLFSWGFDCALNSLKLSRPGFIGIISVSYSGGNIVELQIRKVGNVYYFEYRQPGSQNWITAGSQTETIQPVDIGLIGKTWTNIALTADFDYLRLAGDQVAIVTTDLPDGQVLDYYSADVEATGGVAPYSWSITAGSLPAGMVLDTQTGEMYGTPTEDGTFNFTVQVTDNSAPQGIADHTFSIDIHPLPALNITTTTLADAQSGVPYAQQLEAQGGILPYNWSITSGQLPTGLALEQSTGIISGTPTQTGAFPITVQVTDSQNPQDTDSQGLSLNVNAPPPPVILTEYLPTGFVNGIYAAKIQVTGGLAPYTWSISSGNLPAGISLGSQTGYLTGTPTQSGSFNVTIQVTDSQNPAVSDNKPLQLSVVTQDGKSPIPPAWVYEPWVWEDNDNTQTALQDLVNGYLSRDIPVGVVIIDSPWETSYNTFLITPDYYPTAQQMIDNLHAQNIKVINWITPLINVSSLDGPNTGKASNYDYAKQQDYLINNGATYNWWKGVGSFIDYTNPGAVDWWHGQMDQTLALGIDGWKPDAANRLFPASTFCFAGTIEKKEYGRLYYQDFYEYTMQKTGDAGITFTKPFDENPADSTYVPRMFSHTTWVGDQLHTWDNQGLLNALNNIFLTAERGFIAIGSDIAGYMGSTAVTKNLLIRWAQLGAMCPIMENGGAGEHRPWAFDTETVSIYRYFAKLHSQLVPYFYTHAVDAHTADVSLILPQTGTWQYKLGNDIFVSAIYQDVTQRSVTVPAGDNWIDYWNDDVIYAGGTTIPNYSASLDKYPIFLRQGAMIPMKVKDNITGHGSAASAGRLTMLVYPAASSAFVLHQENKADISYTCLKNTDSIRVDISGGQENYIFCVKYDVLPTMVQQGTQVLVQKNTFAEFESSGSGWYLDTGKKRAWVKFSTTGTATWFTISTQNPPLSITTTVCPEATEGVAYFLTILTQGGITPFSWEVAAGNLPSGLSLHEQTGVISGTPTQEGIYQFTVRVQDSDTPPAQDEKQYTINVNSQSSIDEEFVTGSFDGYTVHIPVAGPDINKTSRQGYARFNLPGTFGFDHWTHKDYAPQLRRPLDPGDFQVETRCELTSTGGYKYHIGLMVYFSQYDVFYWGYSEGGTTLKVSRSGSHGLIVVNYSGGNSVDLRIRKTGNVYYFEYRKPGVSGWTIAGNLSTDTVPVDIGLIVKTWAVFPLVVDFDYLRLTGEEVTIVTTSLPDGQVASAYSQTLQASGGTAPYLWAVTSGQLPSGLSLTGNTGVFSGTPTLAETAAFTVQVTDSDNPPGTATRNLSITIDPIPPLQITTTGCPNAILNNSYSIQLSAQGGQAPYNWTISAGALPTGLGLGQQTGQISGTATQLGSYNFTVQVTDSQNPQQTDTQQLSIEVVDMPAVDEEFVSGSFSGYTVYLPAAGAYWSQSERTGYARVVCPSSAKYDHWYAVDNAPQLRRPLSGGDWQISTKCEMTSVGGTKFQIGLLVYFSQYDVFYWGFSESLTTLKMSRTSYHGLISVGYTGGNSVELRIRKVGTTYYFDYRAPGSTTWITAGSNTTSTTPVDVGLICKTWSTIDIIADFDYLRLVGDELTILTDAVPSGYVDVSYNHQVEAGGGTAPYLYEVESGALPTGYTLDNQTGVISGSTSTTGTYNFRVRVTDSSNPQENDHADLSLEIIEPPAIDEEFNLGTLEGYTEYVPSPGAYFSLDERSDYLRVVLPNTGVFDHWSTVDNMPQLRRPVSTGDWFVETKMELTDNSGIEFHTGLMVYFSQYDLFYWGMFGNNSTLKCSKTGKVHLITASYSGGDVVELAIRKQASLYSFEYREPGSPTWIVAGVYSKVLAPVDVGIFGKTWRSVQAIADFDYLRLDDQMAGKSLSRAASEATDFTAIPDKFSLSENFPNPFNNFTRVMLALVEPALVQTSIYNVNGQLVRKLAETNMPAGYFLMTWDGCGSDGKPAHSGIYFMTIKINEKVYYRKLTLIK